MKRFLRVLLIILLILVLLVAALLGFLTLTEYRPADREQLTVSGNATRTLSPRDSFSVLTWNTGYGALGDNADFFMDGGTGVITADKARVETNLAGMRDAIRSLDPDVFFLQEVDTHSTRSHMIDEGAFFASAFPEYTSSHAVNYKTLFVPYPIPPLGQVDCGIETFSRYGLSEAERIQLPCPFSWPVRLANLKRCLLLTRIPIEGQDRDLVIINLHLEAYDDGEGKIAQTKMLASILQEEVAKGNSVIAGGDFNQVFSSVDASMYPHYEGTWQMGQIDVDSFGSDFSFLMDTSSPTCRSLDRPYAGANPEDFQYYMIDGFIVSSDLAVEQVQTLSLDFAATDHNPVMLKVTLP